MNWVDFSGFLEKKLNVKSSHFLSFAFTKEFFVDFRTSSTKGSCTYFRWTIYVFILMPHAYPLGKSRKFVFNIFGNYRCQRILLSFFELTMAKMKIFCFFDANFRKFPKLISKFIDLMKEWMHSADLAKSLRLNNIMLTHCVACPWLYLKQLGRGGWVVYTHFQISGSKLKIKPKTAPSNG